MALVDPATFDDKAVAMVYIAGRLREGKQVEQVLSDNAIDYAVDAEPFESRVLGILPVTYEGVGFYVLLGRRSCAASRAARGGPGARVWWRTMRRCDWCDRPVVASGPRPDATTGQCLNADRLSGGWKRSWARISPPGERSVCTLT